MPLPAASPWYVDPAAGVAGRLAFALPATRARGPAAGAARRGGPGAVRSRVAGQKAGRAAAAQTDVAEEVRNLPPRPTLTLSSERLWAWSQARTCATWRCCGSTMPARSSRPGDQRQSLRRAEGNRVVVVPRQLKAERAAERRLRELGLQPARRSHGRATPAAGKAFTLQSTAEVDWWPLVHRGLPALEAEGWAIVDRPQLPPPRGRGGGRLGGLARRDRRRLVLPRSGHRDRGRADPAAAGAGAGGAPSRARPRRPGPVALPTGHHPVRAARRRPGHRPAHRSGRADAGDPDRAVRRQSAVRGRNARRLVEPGAGSGRARGGPAAALARRRAPGCACASACAGWARWARPSRRRACGRPCAATSGTAWPGCSSSARARRWAGSSPTTWAWARRCRPWRTSWPRRTAGRLDRPGAGGLPDQPGRQLAARGRRASRRSCAC